MGGYAITNGTLRAKNCSEVREKLKELDELAHGMDEQQVDVRNANRRRYGAGVLEIDINVSGYCSASHACGIDDRIRELGAYATEGARFFSEWEGQQDHFYVGSGEQVAVAESRDALERIQELAPKLRGEEITAALNTVICDTQLPAYKRKYLENSGGLCPFCESRNISSGRLEADGPVAWAEVDCGDCGSSWHDVWSLTDIDEAKDKKGARIDGSAGSTSAEGGKDGTP